MGLRPIPQYKGGINAVQWLLAPFEIFDFSNGCNYYSTPYSQRKRSGPFVFSLFAVCGSKKGKSIHVNGGMYMP